MIEQSRVSMSNTPVTFPASLSSAAAAAAAAVRISEDRQRVQSYFIFYIEAASSHDLMTTAAVETATNSDVNRAEELKTLANEAFKPTNFLNPLIYILKL